MLYFVIEALLIVCFTITDLFNLIQASAVLKFASILVNTIMLFIYLRKGSERKTGKMVAALILTLFADVFLILLDRCYLLGVLLFCSVQSLYGLELIFLKTDKPWKRILGRVLAYGVVLGVLFAADMLDALTAASAYSMTQLSINMVSSFHLSRKKKERWIRLMAAGLALFWLCDASVGLRNAASYIGSFPAVLSTIAGYIIWWFYLPSQMLLVQSVRSKDR